MPILFGFLPTGRASANLLRGAALAFAGKPIVDRNRFLQVWELPLMGRIIYGLSQSLDGYVADLAGGLDWTTPDAALHEHFRARVERESLALLGRRMYETMLVWETLDQRPGATAFEKAFGPVWRATPRRVVSTTLTQVEGNARLVDGDVAAAIRDLKATTPGEIAVSGATLAASLRRWGLIDEYQLYMIPVVLGAGQPFFRAERSFRLTFLGSELVSPGVMRLRYAPAGAA